MRYKIHGLGANLEILVNEESVIEEVNGPFFKDFVGRQVIEFREYLNRNILGFYFELAGVYPSGQRGETVNLLASAFGGSNPSAPTIIKIA